MATAALSPLITYQNKPQLHRSRENMIKTEVSKDK